MQAAEIYGVAPQGRVLALVLGIALCLWTWSRLGKRALLLSIGSIFTAVGLGLVGFAAVPTLFDRVAYAVGVKYPPLLYLILLLLCLSGLLLHLASRISLLDTRCRRLTQELALRDVERKSTPSEAQAEHND